MVAPEFRLRQMTPQEIEIVLSILHNLVGLIIAVRTLALPIARRRADE